MTSFAPLFSKGRFGKIETKNRIAMPALHLGLAVEGRPSEAMLRFYEQRAIGGAGTITVGVCNTWNSPDSKLVGALSLCDDGHIAGMSDLVSRIKNHGAIAGVQISPLVGYNDPNWIPDPTEIGEIISSIGMAARRAMRAGFDFVEIMLSGGALLSLFVSPVHNRWKIKGYSDGWDERLAAPLEALDAVRKEVDDRLAITARIHCHEFIEGGYGVEGACIIAKALADGGIDAINVTGAGHRTSLPQLTRQIPALAFAHLARRISSKVDIPIFYGGRLRTPSSAVDALSTSGAELVNMCRALLVDPKWPEKAANGDTNGLVTCMACGSCFDQVFSKSPLSCSLNPEVGEDPILAMPHTVTGKVLVIGGGPAGMQAALSYASMGHDVTLYEQRDSLGGRWALVSCLNGRSDLGDSCRAFANRLSTAGVHVNTGVEITPQEIKELGADIIVLAVGARPHYPDIPGIDSHPHVMHADDVLENSTVVGKKVAIIGAGGAGVELAIHVASLFQPSLEALGFLARFGNEEWLAQAFEHDKDRQVTLLKRRGYVGKGLGRSVRWTMMQDLDRLGVRVIDRTTFEKISRRGVHIFNGRTGDREIIEADTIITATGYESDPSILNSFEGCAKEIIVVGNANKVGDIGAAIAGAWKVARSIS
jgi:2,4-dienoyl-CoA reductase (NADPH2)